MISAKDVRLSPTAEIISDIQENERFVSSRLGYRVELLDSKGDFRNVIIVPDDTSEFTYLRSEYINYLDYDLKGIVASYLRYILERNLSSTVRHKFKFIDRLAKELTRGTSLNDFLDEVSALNGRHRQQFISTCKEFLRFALLHEYEWLCLDKYEDFMRLRDYSGRKNSYLSLFMMDEERGPFSKEEITILSAQVDNESLPLAFRLILDLCLCFGLRPIQLSMLKRKDFIKDVVTGVRYLNVPRVKQRSAKRRSKFSSRLLSERTANLLEFYINSSDTPIGFDPGELPIFISPKAIDLEADGNSRGSHYWEDDERISSDYFADEAKMSVQYHKSSCRINYMLWGNEHRLPLSPRTGKRFNLCAYRFRYTVGTQAVMSGCTPEEVADLLDHEGTSSIKHYFRFTHEMWEILEAATLNRIEQKHFTAAWMKEGELKGNVYSQVCEPRNFNVIGKCASKSICFEEPAITCYSCSRFCPNKSTVAHEAALEGLIERKEQLLMISTANVVSVIDQAIAGCHAAIAYSEGNEVLLINSKEF
ncbi:MULTISPECIES: hypothetical protein [Pseudomonadaceae]|jgi:integrase|uniref:Integrase n=2 Tax=Pseudomonadaceae TaxID=135621 RepID=A0A6J4DXK5_9PSED|nr:MULTISPECIES: hypothetical protein [Pseudomonas]KJU80921.1 hypothetical protein N619_01680 [Pseudomonas oleovorans]MCE0864902.1 site-specific integrase [Pseudomonas alloputida]MDG9922296.1 site-specific integrase [Pseudomonas sp. GD04045]MDH0034506.1 site-specific integrase [Pseudomonas sp. GD04019]MDH0895587.1 site-specific integrase [Pseudomonas sp. GD03875]